ncbi:DUF3311 domain-containing protein [Lysinibacillus agricola]|uniref:DUF3311 domain-containing protein n=1 Tax=Lysinibacillus agricola TaxID=2590012 RepID=A0ABX7AWF3_9BACI|nr:MULTISPECIES: DUF3311 domain-containing protein [Lysinibacillus]KOS64196.1 hypothetical protein AN161_03115 [Lysinibacillus sp. FJAT-14222]QQP14307.1 DUF3311 domain-containing protein [Lysinibacillus agricola]
MKWIKLLAILPFIGFISGALFANKVTPFVLGLPFFAFWCSLWVILTSVIMAIVYRFDPDNKEGDMR